MTLPNNKRQFQTFIVIVNYYRDMWVIWSNLLKPLPTLTPDKVTFRWTEVE